MLVDHLGFGCSDKPDLRYGLRRYADGAEAALAHLGIDHVDLLTHDLGDSVGGELLARSLEGTLGFTVGRRVLTNGSIYMDLVELTLGQQLLLGLPWKATPPSAPTSSLRSSGRPSRSCWPRVSSTRSM